MGRVKGIGAGSEYRADVWKIVGQEGDRMDCGALWLTAGTVWPSA